MSKSCHYYISGVWKDANKRVTSVMLHQVFEDDSFTTKGTKTGKAEVLKLIKQGTIIKTLVWQYPRWLVGAKVTYETVNHVEYLKTVPDASTKNNLDNSLPMENFLG